MRFLYRVENSSKNEFLHECPSIHNTNCRTASFEFHSFELNGGVIPKFAVSLNDEHQIYIGRCRVLNTEGYVLCKIMPTKQDRIEVIGHNNPIPMEQLQNTFEVAKQSV